MAERGIFVYPGDQGEIMVTFERGTKGFQAEALVPPSCRGEAFGAFRVPDYFNLATTVLVSPADWQQSMFSAEKPFASGQTNRSLHIATLDLDYLDVRLPDDSPNQNKAAELFEVVAAYWFAKPGEIGLPGGVAAFLWHEGFIANEIINYLRHETDAKGMLKPSLLAEHRRQAHQLLRPDQALPDNWRMIDGQFR